MPRQKLICPQGVAWAARMDVSDCAFLCVTSDPSAPDIPAEPEKSIQEQLPLIVGLATASLVVLIAVVVVAIVCLK